jgi:biopolymer transport protein ExbD
VPKVHAAGDLSPGRGRTRRVTTSLAEINVVPLVDVMLVLLIIFMVTAPMIQRGIDVKLPVSRRASAVEGERLFITVPAAF